MHMLVLDVSRPHRRRKFDIGIRPVALLVTQVRHHRPGLPVERMAQSKLRMDIRSTSKEARMVIGEIHLHGSNVTCMIQVNRQPFAGPVCAGQPERARIFVGHIRRRVRVTHR